MHFGLYLSTYCLPIWTVSCFSLHSDILPTPNLEADAALHQRCLCFILRIGGVPSGWTSTNHKVPSNVQSLYTL